METLTILLLAYNEADTIGTEISDWQKILGKLENVRTEILIVEDGSTDGTTQILLEKMKQGDIKHLHSSSRNGYKNALIRGLEASQSDFIFMSDTGLKNDLRDFNQFWQQRNEIDLLVGHKVMRTDSKFRQITTKVFNLYLRIIFQDPALQDTDCGFRLLNRDFANFVVEKGLSFKEFANSEMSLLARQKFTFRQLPISYHGRKGESRGLPLKKIPKAIVGVIKDINTFKVEEGNQ
jgi:glycosyltransferase involved in cell wall biosynthesis